MLFELAMLRMFTTSTSSDCKVVYLVSSGRVEKGAQYADKRPRRRPNLSALNEQMIGERSLNSSALAGRSLSSPATPNLARAYGRLSSRRASS